jgi:CRP-like cAMP-binding protein
LIPIKGHRMNISKNGGRARRGGPSPALTPLLGRKLAAFADVGERDLDHLRTMAHAQLTAAAGTDVIRTGQVFGPVMLVNEGWAIRYRTHSDGRRQIANFILPGDFMCLNATVMEQSDYDITAVTELRYTTFRVEDVVGLIERRPILCAAIFWCTAREEAILLEHLMSLGRRSAYERVAHLLVELWRRLQFLGLADGDSFEMPLTQELIADCLGLTSIHVNRMMRSMQAKRLIVCSHRPRHRCRILDVRGLEAAAGFEDGYLHLGGLPRPARDALRSLRRPDDDKS